MRTPGASFAAASAAAASRAAIAHRTMRVVPAPGRSVDSVGLRGLNQTATVVFNGKRATYLSAVAGVLLTLAAYAIYVPR